MKNHPYKLHEDTQLWKTLNRGIEQLVENGDISESTSREHIVGYLCQMIAEAKKRKSKKD